MHFLQALGLVALATSVSALPVPQDNSGAVPEGYTSTPPAGYDYQATAAATTTVAVDVPAATATPSAVPSTGIGAGPSTDGTGMTIVNNLKIPIYVWSVAETQGEMHTLQPGEKFSEAYKTNSNGGGVSLKVGLLPALGKVLQLEYTLDGEKLFYDMSSIDLLELTEIIAEGFGLTNNADRNSVAETECEPVVCAGGDKTCAASYQHPDDVATHACPSKYGQVLNVGPKA